VTGTQEEADAAGKSGEMSHQMALAGKALKRDMETILLSQQPRNDGADDTTARKTRGLEHWITTNVDYGAGGSNGANATTALTDGTQRAFTEGLLANTIQAAYDNGAEPDHLLMGSNVKRQFSTFTGRTASRVTIDQDEILAYADFYLSDFGELKAYPSRWIRSRTVIGWDPEYTKVAYYRKFVKVDIAKIGDAETKLILSEYGLQCSNEKAHFKIADLLTNVTPTFGAMAAGAQSAPVTNATLTATPNATDPSEVSVTTSPNTAGVIDWGDGTPTAAFSGSGSHIYNAPGDFTVTLRDNGGVTLGTVNVNVPV
jgi:hypothetical protein